MIINLIKCDAEARNHRYQDAYKLCKFNLWRVRCNWRHSARVVDFVFCLRLIVPCPVASGRHGLTPQSTTPISQGETSTYTKNLTTSNLYTTLLNIIIINIVHILQCFRIKANSNVFKFTINNSNHMHGTWTAMLTTAGVFIILLTF